MPLLQRTGLEADANPNTSFHTSFSLWPLSNLVTLNYCSATCRVKGGHPLSFLPQAVFFRKLLYELWQAAYWALWISVSSCKMRTGNPVLRPPHRVLKIKLDREFYWRGKGREIPVPVMS